MMVVISCWSENIFVIIVLNACLYVKVAILITFFIN